MARIPNQYEASSVWKLNDVYVAQNGGDWVTPYIPPPNYADGYVHRFINNGYGPSGDNSGSNNMVNNWQIQYQAGHVNAICMRMDRDFELHRVYQGNSLYPQGGTVYFNLTVWEGEYINNTTAGALKTSTGNTSVGTGWNYNPTNAVQLWTAPNYGESTYRFSANTWYTIGVSYYQSSAAYSGNWYGGNGYGWATNNASWTCTASNAGGTTSLTTFTEWKSTNGLWTSSGIWTQNSNWANSNQGPLGGFKVKVFA